MSILDDEDILINDVKQTLQMYKANEEFWDFMLCGTGAHGVEVGHEFVTDLQQIISQAEEPMWEPLKKHAGRPIRVLDCKTLRKYDAIGWLEAVSKLPKSPTPILVIENITEIPEENAVHDNPKYVENLLVHSWKNEKIDHYFKGPDQVSRKFTLKSHDYLVFLTWSPDRASKINNVWNASDNLAWIGNFQKYKDDFISDLDKQ